MLKEAYGEPAGRRLSWFVFNIAQHAHLRAEQLGLRAQLGLRGGRVPALLLARRGWAAMGGWAARAAAGRGALQL